MFWPISLFGIYFLKVGYSAVFGAALKMEQADEEKLVKYSMAIDSSSRDQLLSNEKYYLQRYKVKTLTDESYALLDYKGKEPEELIEDEPTYRPIEIEDYRLRFDYDGHADDATDYVDKRLSAEER